MASVPAEGLVERDGVRVGYAVFGAGGAAEAVLFADWNAERVERMRRYPRLRDRSIFVGNPDDLVDVPLGSELPTVRDWALERYTCTGYVTGPGIPDDREALRAELGYQPGVRVCLVSVGGSGWEDTCCAGSPRRSRWPRRLFLACA